MEMRKIIFAQEQDKPENISTIRIRILLRISGRQFKCLFGSSFANPETFVTTFRSSVTFSTEGCREAGAQGAALNEPPVIRDNNLNLYYMGSKPNKQECRRMDLIV
jgi:hypothetical protein